MSNAKPHDPRTKTSIIVSHMAAGDWRNAIRVAARLPRLDKHRAAILDAQGAYENPRFYAQIGKDAEILIEAGAAAFGHNQENATMTIELKNYSNASNARRAAKAAGLSEFDVYKGADGWYKIRAAAAKALPVAKRTKAATDKAAKAAKPAKAVKPPKAAGLDPWRAAAKRINDALTKDKNGRPLSKRAAVLAAAQAGKLPPPPDFSAPTHTRYRAEAQLLVDLAKSGDIEGLKAMVIKPYSSSPKAMAKYRDLAVIALEARAAEEKRSQTKIADHVDGYDRDDLGLSPDC